MTGSLNGNFCMYEVKRSGDSSGTVMGNKYNPFASSKRTTTGLSQLNRGRVSAESTTTEPAANSMG